MTPEQIEELKAQTPKNFPEEYLAVAHVYSTFLDGVNALNHMFAHVKGGTLIPADLAQAGEKLLAAIQEPIETFQNALEVASDATASPELREFSKKVQQAMQPQIAISEDGVLDLSSKDASGMLQ